MNDLIKFVETEYREKVSGIVPFKSGDTINVHVKIKEGNKERIQQYQGVVLQRKNPNTNGESFTVRKVSNGVAVERIFPLLSPSIDKIEMVRKGAVRRARLFYLRDKTGKSAKIKENKRTDDTKTRKAPQGKVAKAKAAK
ncbi:MAG TPA: 50S ribosomal protein L19 [Cytophagaceae bacterium]|jgi:large subunit ribosomal protein L19